VGPDRRTPSSHRRSGVAFDHAVPHFDGAPHSVHIIVNRIHPYYAARPTVEAIYECIRQYIYDAVAEYRVAQLIKVTPDSVRRMKDALLRADANRIENLDAPAATNANDKAATG
jgi:hypothetical protein